MPEHKPLVHGHDASLACSPYRQSDVSKRSCQSSWCNIVERASHCRWCKCAACAFCDDFAATALSATTTRQQHPTHSEQPRLAVIAAFKKEHPPWLADAPIPYVILDKSHIPNTGLDASTYLWYILHHYHNLPRWVLFIHLHEYHWHHSLHSSLSSMLIDMDATGLAFLSVNHGDTGKFLLYRKDTLPQLSRQEHEQLRIELLGLTSPYAGELQHPPGSQFWVSRERIRVRPLRYYQQLFAAITDENHPTLKRPASMQGYPDRQSHDFFIEGYWHYIMGENETYHLPYESYEMLPFHAWDWPANRVLAVERLAPSGVKVRCDNPLAWKRHKCSSAATVPVRNSTVLQE